MAVNRTASLEQLIAQIDAAHKSAASAYHQSELAENSISNATATITEVVKSLALGDFESVDRLHNVAWFYAKFAQDIVAAESTEHLLGNDRFFDLIEPQAKVQLQLQELLQLLSGKLDELESRIPEFWELEEASKRGSRGEVD